MPPCKIRKVTDLSSPGRSDAIALSVGEKGKLQKGEANMKNEPHDAEETVSEGMVIDDMKKDTVSIVKEGEEEAGVSSGYPIEEIPNDKAKSETEEMDEKPSVNFSRTNITGAEPKTEAKDDGSNSSASGSSSQ